VPGVNCGHSRLLASVRLWRAAFLGQAVLAGLAVARVPVSSADQTVADRSTALRQGECAP
jgi:hypothetical protein